MAPSNQDEFDGYRKWLGIADKKRPPTHYELLAISLDEDDPDVIRAAAEQRRHFVESKRGEGHDSVVTEILYRIGEAEATLLNDEMRRDYDRQLNIFEKRRKNRQVDPLAPRSRIKSQSGRTVGEDSGIVKTFIGIMVVVCVGFGGMAWFSFGLPWSKPAKQVDAAPGQPALPVVQQPAQPEVQNPVEQVVVQQPVAKAPDSEAPVAQPEKTPVTVEADAATDEKMETSTVQLLEGKLLDVWQGMKKSDDISNWSLSDGVLTLKAADTPLRTKQTFRDFDLHLEFKLPPKCNTGVFLRGRFEVQLVDSQVRKNDGTPFDAVQKCGAIYGQIAPLKDMYRGPNKWNKLDVRLVGETVTVRMNDTLIIDAKELKGPTSGALDTNESDPGPIFLQSHSVTGLAFRNITIKPLADTNPVESIAHWKFSDPIGAGQTLEQAFTVSREGTLVSTARAKDVCLATVDEFSECTVKLEFQFPDGEVKGGPFVSVGSSRPNPDGNDFGSKFPFGFEVKLAPNIAGQVVLPPRESKLKLHPEQKRDPNDSRRIFPIRSPKVKSEEWNKLEIKSDKDRNLTVTINGTTVNQLMKAQSVTGHVVIWPGVSEIRIRNVVIANDKGETKMSFEHIEKQ